MSMLPVLSVMGGIAVLYIMRAHSMRVMASFHGDVTLVDNMLFARA